MNTVRDKEYHGDECWLKLLEFQLQHQSFQWIFGLICFRIDWFDFLAVQGTLKSPLQHHSSKASILWRSGFFIVQLSHPWLLSCFSHVWLFAAHELKPTRLLHPWDSPGKNTGVGCHFLLHTSIHDYWKNHSFDLTDLWWQSNISAL